MYRMAARIACRARLTCTVLLAIVGLIGANGCIVHDRAIKTSLAPTAQRPAQAAILFFIDGLGNDKFQEALDAGDVPNIKRYIVERGLTYRRTVTCMPSITYAATATFLTGQSPGTHGIVGNRWFDPYSMRYQAYGYIKTYRTAQDDFIAPTIFEMLHDHFTVSIQVATRRGVTREIDNWATSGINWFFGYYTNVDKLTAMRFDLIAEMANQTGHWPDFILAYFPGCDEVAHRFGVNTPRYRAAIRNVDEQIGRICRGLEKAGMFDRTLLVLTSDHGQQVLRDGEGVVDAAKELASHYGMRVTDKRFDNPEYMKRFAFYNQYDVVVVPDAPRLLGLHVRQVDRPWYDRPADVRPVQLATRNGPLSAKKLAQDLSQREFARLVAMRAGVNAVELISRTGTAQLQTQGTAAADTILYRYEILQGDDPLQLGLAELNPTDDSGQARQLTLPGPQWLSRTMDSPNPGVVSQLVTYFNSSRTGDIVVFAEPGYGFGLNESGHGSITPQEMRVPLIFAGPGVRPGITDKAARIHSVTPTIMTSLGLGKRLPMPPEGPALPLTPEP